MAIVKQMKIPATIKALPALFLLGACGGIVDKSDARGGTTAGVSTPFGGYVQHTQDPEGNRRAVIAAGLNNPNPAANAAARMLVCNAIARKMTIVNQHVTREQVSRALGEDSKLSDCPADKIYGGSTPMPAVPAPAPAPVGTSPTDAPVSRPVIFSPRVN